MSAQGNVARKFLSHRRAFRGCFLENPAEITHIPGYRTEFLKRLVFGLDRIKPEAEPLRQPITSHQSPAPIRSRAERIGASAEMVPWAEVGGTNRQPKAALRAKAQA